MSKWMREVIEWLDKSEDELEEFYQEWREENVEDLVTEKWLHSLSQD